MKDIILQYKELNENVNHYVLAKMFGLSLEGLFKVLDIKYYQINDLDFNFYNKKGQIIYGEDCEKFWFKVTYNHKGDKIYEEDSYGWWEKTEYDEYRRKVYTINAENFWAKWEYDERGNNIYEITNDYWVKWEYDNKNKKINKLSSLDKL